jgi:hypothetical protein
MSIESNIEQIERQILEQSGYLEKGLTERLASLVGEIQQKLIQGDFQSRTGNLRKSMKTTLDGYGLTIQMLNYGYFQSFGVRGTKGGRSIGLPPEVAGAFGVAEGYNFQFKSKAISPESGLPFPVRRKIATFGIRPKDFFFNDIDDKIIEILTSDGTRT